MQFYTSNLFKKNTCCLPQVTMYLNCCRRVVIQFLPFSLEPIVLTLTVVDSWGTKHQAKIAFKWLKHLTQPILDDLTLSVLNFYELQENSKFSCLHSYSRSLRIIFSQFFTFFCGLSFEIWNVHDQEWSAKIIQHVRKFLLQTSRAYRGERVDNFFFSKNPCPEMYRFRAAGTRSSL